MAYLLTDLLQAVYRDLGDSLIAVASGGSTTTCTVTTLANQLTEDDILEGGTVFVVRDSGGASAAPEGEFGRISAFNSTTSVITFSNTLTAVIASGDTVQIVKGIYPIDQMLVMANDAMQLIGKINRYTTLTTVSEQREYTLGVDYIHSTPYLVQWQPDSDTDDWIPIANYYLTHTAPGSAPTIFLPLLEAGKTVRVWYKTDHPRLTAYSSTISEKINPLLARAALRLTALRWNVRRQQGGGDFLTQDLNQAEQNFNNMMATYPMEPLPKPKRYIGW